MRREAKCPARGWAIAVWWECISNADGERYVAVHVMVHPSSTSAYVLFFSSFSTSRRHGYAIHSVSLGPQLIKRSANRTCPRHHSLHIIEQTAPGAAAPSVTTLNFELGDRMMRRKAFFTSGCSSLKPSPTQKGNMFLFDKRHMSHARQRLKNRGTPRAASQCF